MKKNVLFLIICHLALSELSAQTVGGIPGKGLDMQSSPGGFVTQLPMAPPGTKGDVYLSPDWELTDITLFSPYADLKGYPVKFNLQTNDLEINYQDQTKVLSGRGVRQFVIKKNNGGVDKYVNARKYRLNNVPVDGFLKVIDSSKWELLSKHQLKLVQANYVAALDAGERDNKLVKEEVFFLAKDHLLYEIRLSQKKFCKQFNENELLVSKFIKEQGINLKKFNDLVVLLNFLNGNI